MAAKEKTRKPAENKIHLTVKVYQDTEGIDYMCVVIRGLEPLLQKKLISSQPIRRLKHFI